MRDLQINIVLLVLVLVGIALLIATKPSPHLAEVAEPIKNLVSDDQQKQFEKATKLEILPPKSKTDLKPLIIERPPAEALERGEKALWVLSSSGRHPIVQSKIESLFKKLKEIPLGELVYTAPSMATPGEVERDLARYRLTDRTAWVIRLSAIVQKPILDASGKPRVENGVQLVALEIETAFAVMVAQSPEAKGEDRGPWLFRVGQSRKVKDAQGRDKVEWEFSREVRRVPSFPSALLKADPFEWIEHDVATFNGSRFGSNQIFRVEISGQHLEQPVVLQRFTQLPNTAEELADMSQKQTAWHFASDEPMLLTSIGDPANNEAVQFFLNDISGLQHVALLEENKNSALPTSPYLKITLFHTNTIEQAISINRLELEAQLWGLLAYYCRERQQQAPEVSVVEFMGYVAENFGTLPQEQLSGFLTRNLGPNSLDPKFAPDSNTPGIDVFYGGKTQRLTRFQVAISAEGFLPAVRYREAHLRLQAELSTSIAKAGPAVSAMAQSLSKQMERLESDLERARTAAEKRRLLEQKNVLNNKMLRVLYGRTVELVITREAPKDEPPQTQPQTQPQTTPDRGTYRVLTNSSDPAFGYWYKITSDVVARLRKTRDDFKPAPPALPNPQVRISTNHGDIVVELFEDAAPNTVANFIELVESGFYDGTRFHRIVRKFMIQGGDPNTKHGIGPDAGRGGPGYRIADEFTPNHNFNQPWMLAMANAGPNTSGSQFFITTTPTPNLNDSPGTHYNLFGKVIEGMDVVQKIEVLPVAEWGDGNPETSKPMVDVVILKMTVLRKRDHPYKVTRLPQ